MLSKWHLLRRACDVLNEYPVYASFPPQRTERIISWSLANKGDALQKLVIKKENSPCICRSIEMNASNTELFNTNCYTPWDFFINKVHQIAMNM